MINEMSGNRAELDIVEFVRLDFGHIVLANIANRVSHMKMRSKRFMALSLATRHTVVSWIDQKTVS